MTESPKKPERFKEPAAEHRANDANDDVAEEAISESTYHGARKQSGDESDNEPGKNVHDSLQGLKDAPSIYGSARAADG